MQHYVQALERTPARGLGASAPPALANPAEGSSLGVEADSGGPGADVRSHCLELTWPHNLGFSLDSTLNLRIRS